MRKYALLKKYSLEEMKEFDNLIESSINNLPFTFSYLIGKILEENKKQSYVQIPIKLVP